MVDEIKDVEELFERTAVAGQSSPIIIALGHPTRFRRVKYVLALAKGILLGEIKE